MICEHCGTEHEDGGSGGFYNREPATGLEHTAARCRDALKAQLAEMRSVYELPNESGSVVMALVEKLKAAEQWASGLQSDCDALGAKIDIAKARIIALEGRNAKIEASVSVSQTIVLPPNVLEHPPCAACSDVAMTSTMRECAAKALIEAIEQGEQDHVITWIARYREQDAKVRATWTAKQQVDALLHENASLKARISELEDTIDLTEAEDLIASSYGRNTDACAVAKEIHTRRGSNWTGALTSRELAEAARHSESESPVIAVHFGPTGIDEEVLCGELGFRVVSMNWNEVNCSACKAKRSDA
jgi:hypothetical protein